MPEVVRAEDCDELAFGPRERRRPCRVRSDPGGLEDRPALPTEERPRAVGRPVVEREPPETCAATESTVAPSLRMPSKTGITTVMRGRSSSIQ